MNEGEFTRLLWLLKEFHPDAAPASWLDYELEGGSSARDSPPEANQHPVRDPILWSTRTDTIPSRPDQIHLRPGSLSSGL